MRLLCIVGAMDVWDKKSLAVLVGGIVVVLLLACWLLVAVDCDAFPSWCTAGETQFFNTQTSATGGGPLLQSTQ